MNKNKKKMYKHMLELTIGYLVIVFIAGLIMYNVLKYGLW